MTLTKIATAVGVVVTVATLLFSLLQFLSTQALEAEKPFLTKKLEWCEEAKKTAAKIAVRTKGSVDEDIARFKELYWGVMGMVEGGDVTAAMIAFKKAIDLNGQGNGSLALDIAHACRRELASEWSPIWRITRRD
jgi:hypothetical protein